MALIASIATVDDIASVAGADLIVATVGINHIPTGQTLRPIRLITAA